MEAKRIAEWTAKKNRIEEASRKKSEMDKEFSIQAKESLQIKMENYEENREAIMSEIKDKLKVRYTHTLQLVYCHNRYFLFNNREHFDFHRCNFKKSRKVAFHWSSRSTLTA